LHGWNRERGKPWPRTTTAVTANEQIVTAIDANAPFLAFETAAEHLCSSVPVLAPDARVRESRAALLGARFECASDLAVCDRGRLVGIVTIEALLAGSAEACIRDIMDADPPRVHLAEDQEIAAWKALQHGERAIAVVADGDRFLGIIPPRRLLAVLLSEHHEDIARLTGVLRSARSARTPLEEPIPYRFAHRLPWLLVGLAGALLAADAVAWFERDLRAHLVLAFFLPGIVYIADAVGTQTETLAIRGLSAGVTLRDIVWREIATGSVIGAGLALVAAPLMLWRWGATDITLIMTLALVSTCSVASAVAIILPWTIDKLGSDPAFGSGPLATVIQDLLSIVIYLGIAAAVLR
jgi:magnesium transporter